MVPCKILSPRGSVCSPHGPSSRQHPKGLSRRLLARSSGLLGWSKANPHVPSCCPRSAPHQPCSRLWHLWLLLPADRFRERLLGVSAPLGPEPPAPFPVPVSGRGPCPPSAPQGRGGSAASCTCSPPPSLPCFSSIDRKIFSSPPWGPGTSAAGLGGAWAPLSSTSIPPPLTPSRLVAEPSLPASTVSPSPLLPSPVTFTRNLFKCF